MHCNALLQGIFPTQGLNLSQSAALAGRFFTTTATWEAQSQTNPVLFLLSAPSTTVSHLFYLFISKIEEVLMNVYT